MVLVCVGSAFALRAYNLGQSAERAAAYDEKHNPIKPEEIDALLATQAKALKDRDEKAFLSIYDPTHTKLVKQQTQLFRNLVKVPFAEARFVAQGKDEFEPFGAGGVKVKQRVLFVHKIDGYDLHPVEQEYFWTVARLRKGDPIMVIEAKGEPDRDGDFSYYPAPWDKWPNIHVERTEHTLLIVNGSMKAQAQRYAPEAERAAVEILTKWRAVGIPGEIPGGFVLSLVKNNKELGSLYRMSKEAPPEAGVSFAVPRYRDFDAPVDETVALVGGSRVVVDLDTSFFKSGRSGGPGGIFRHELAHSMVAALKTRSSNTTFFREELWVVEGFAEYMEGKPWTSSERAAAGKQLLRSGRYAAELATTINYDNAEKASLDYWMGHSAISYLAEKYSERKAFEVVVEHYRGTKVEDVLPKVIGVPYKDFVKDWNAYVKAKVG